MKFMATDEQIKQIAANAANAALPVGMGFLHFVAGEPFKSSDFEIQNGYSARSLYLDYVQGRMVKLSLREVSPGLWETNDEISADYESWICRYPTAADLLKSAGVSEMEPRP